MIYVNSIYTPDQTGRLGGVVFGKNKYGFYVKVFKTPSNPRSQGQQDVRAFFAAASREWASLTDAQRTEWDEIASEMTFMKKGVTYTLTGFNLFVKLNRNLQDIAEGYYKDISRTTLVIPAEMNGASVDIDCTPGTEDINLNIPAALASGTKAIVYATPVLKASRKPRWGKLRIIQTIDHTFVSGGSIKDSYVAKFGGMPATGEKAGFAVMPVDATCGLTNAKVYMTAVGTV